MCDETGVKSLFSPFTTFKSSKPVIGKGSPNLKSLNTGDSGLSRKEKGYVINSCQNKSKRYKCLKSLAATAIKENKIFSIYGKCNAVRKALLNRGWVEKIPSHRMNLSKIRGDTFSSKIKIRSELENIFLSNLVEKYTTNFIWQTCDQRRNTTIDIMRDGSTKINKLEIDAAWTSKQGLCSLLKRNYWFYIENVAVVNGPRSYNTFDSSEIEEFVKDYKITACTSLLKWVLAMVARKKNIFVDSGKISIAVLIFALNRCKEYLYRKYNKDIDFPIPSVSANKWNSFFKKYRSVIAKAEVFESDKENKLSLYLSYAKYILKEMQKYRLQLSCEGCHNIWIIKPAYCSRGRGIKMDSKLGGIMSLLGKANSKYVIQKYIEEPLLIHETKFDIRQYYLVTSTYPLIIWMYKDCYLKFSSQKYSLRKYHESIHLTNNAVQRKYKNFKGRHFELPSHNMWELEKYQAYLNNIDKGHVWDSIIYPGMKKTIVGIMLTCQESLRASKNRFELYGCDFILDKDYNPWLIEINSCPDLNHTTQVTAKICPAVISDIIKVVIDYSNNLDASTGKFECIYQQPVSVLRMGPLTDLVVHGFALSNNYFYKENLEIGNANKIIIKENDIKADLYKIRQFYTESANQKQTQRSLKKESLGNMEDEINKLTLSENSISYSLLKENMDLTRLIPIQSVQSITDMRPLIRKSSANVCSYHNHENNFVFSKLDDGSNNSIMNLTY